MPLKERIVIRGVNWIGDAVMTIPALRALRAHYRDSEIHLIVKPWVAPLFYDSPYLDNLILYSAEFSGLEGKIRFSRLLRRESFTRAFLFQNAFDAALLTFLARIPERIGYSREMRRWLLTRPVPYRGEDRFMHHIDYYLELLRRAGIPAEYSRPWIRLALEERLQGRKRLSGLKRPVLAINPGATYGSAKRWFPERFGLIADIFMESTGGSVVLLGSQDEVEIAKEIRRNIKGDDVLILTGKTNLRDLISIISESDVLLSNDSGPMHIGYAVGTPVVAIFGSTDPSLTGPVGYRDIVIRKEVPCSPCFRRRCEEMACMDAIKVDDVASATLSVAPRQRAVFLDRDGTICRDVGYLNDLSGLEVFDDVRGLRALKERGFRLIGVTNQSGIRRGIVREDVVREINEIFINRYGFDAFYYCPHLPDDLCECRKPETGMLMRARAEYNIDLKRSWMIGDKASDISLGKAVGARTILLRTEGLREYPEADFQVNSLKEAIQVILRTEEGSS